jgi:four helix bundle protein
MRNFRELKVWSSGMEIAGEIYKLAAQLPASEKFGITSQISRAAVSIPSNIAEGCSRSSQKDFKRFLEIAIGSAFELETQLMIVRDLKLCGNYSMESLLIKLSGEQKMLNTMIMGLKREVKKRLANT